MFNSLQNVSDASRDSADDIADRGEVIHYLRLHHFADYRHSSPDKACYYYFYNF